MQPPAWACKPLERCKLCHWQRLVTIRSAGAAATPPIEGTSYIPEGHAHAGSHSQLLLLLLPAYLPACLPAACLLCSMLYAASCNTLPRNHTSSKCIDTAHKHRHHGPLSAVHIHWCVCSSAMCAFRASTANLGWGGPQVQLCLLMQRPINSSISCCPGGSHEACQWLSQLLAQQH